jgi:hypothetical protein
VFGIGADFGNVHRMAIEGGQKIFIEAWIFKTLVSGLGKSLWGGDNGPFGDPEFVTHLRYGLQNFTSSRESSAN